MNIHKEISHQVSIPSLAGQTARRLNARSMRLIKITGFNPLISGADRATSAGVDWAGRQEASFNPLISGADRATIAAGIVLLAIFMVVSIPSLAGQTARQ